MLRWSHIREAITPFGKVKNMTEENKRPLFVGMDEINPIVDLILASSEKKEWTLANHVSLLARVSILAYESGSGYGGLSGNNLRIFICRTLDQHGLAGNASQFRQWLMSEKGGSRIAKESSKKTKYV